MSLLDKLKDKALDAVNDEEHHKEWSEKGFDAAMKEARKLVPKEAEGESEELKAVRTTAGYALDKLEKNKDSLVGLGAHGLRSTITMLGLGQYDEAAKHAALIQLRETASWSEVSAAITSTAEAGNRAKRELEAQVEAMKKTFKDIGVAAAKAVLPMLLAVI
jgi:hypothetical protein